MLLAPMVEIFCDIDDFCKHHEENKQLKLPSKAVVKINRYDGSNH